MGSHRHHEGLRKALFLAAALAPVTPFHPALAGVCHPEAVPGATLLLPYFEVDLDNPNGLTTLFSINNAAAPAALTNVTIWSDLGVPIGRFNVYLTGYDVQTINLRDLLLFGNLPQTASVGQDPKDIISPQGLYSQDIDVPSCQGVLPPPPVPGFLVDHAQKALTGRPSPVLQGLCAGQFLGDNIARGYITVDTVRDCAVRFPTDPGYFASGATAGDATDQNVLWGTWYIVNATQGFAQGSDMVAVQADASNPATSTPGNYTFYGRYVAWSAADHRAPLATTFAAQFANGGPFTAGTSYLVWRDTKVSQPPFVCPAIAFSRPYWYPLGQEGLVVFDEQETPSVPETCVFSASARPSAVPSQCPPFPPVVPFPAATQRTVIGAAQYPVPFNFGWNFLDLNVNLAANPNAPPADPRAAQAWVVVTESSHSHFAVALDAYRLDSACSANHALPGPAH